MHTELACLLFPAVLLSLAHAFPKQLLLPYGVKHGDQVVTNNLSEPIMFPPGLILYAHSNGAITDDPARNQPQQFPVNFTVVAPLWTDYSSTGNAYYRLINDNDHSSLGAINHLLQAAGGAIEDPTTVLVATWDDMTCVSNGTVQELTFQCIVARSDEEAIVLFLYSVSMADNIGTDNLLNKNVSDGCLNPIVGYNIPNLSPYTLNVSGGGGQILQSIAESSNATIPGVWIFPITLPPVPPTDTPPTPDIPDVEVRLDIPNWALSVWNVGQTIVSYLAGVGSASLGVVCLNKYKQKREERKKRKKLDAEKGNPIDEDIEMTKVDIEDNENIADRDSADTLNKANSSTALGDEALPEDSSTSEPETVLELENPVNTNQEMDTIVKEELEGEKEVLSENEEELDIGQDDREKIKQLAAITPQKYGKSYSLPMAPVIVTSENQGERSLSLSQSPRRQHMMVIRSPYSSLAHSSLLVSMGERRLSWMALNAEKGKGDGHESPLITSRSTLISSPSRTQNISVSPSSPCDAPGRSLPENKQAEQHSSDLTSATSSKRSLSAVQDSTHSLSHHSVRERSPSLLSLNSKSDNDGDENKNERKAETQSPTAVAATCPMSLCPSRARPPGAVTNRLCCGHRTPSVTAEDEDGSNPEQSDREQSRATSGILCCYRPGAVTTRLCCGHRIPSVTDEDEDDDGPEQGDHEQSRASSGILCCYRPGAVTRRLCCRTPSVTARDKDDDNPEQDDNEQSWATSGISCCYKCKC